MNRQQWKRHYRQLRIIRRECCKAAFDTLLFGTGYIQHGPEVPDFIRHVDAAEVYAPRKQQEARQ